MAVWCEALAFSLAAAAILGSPGPGVAALVAAGRGLPKLRALKFYGTMQVALALAAGASAFGLAELVHRAPALALVLMVMGTAYLLWLAWKIAFAPVTSRAIGGSDADSLNDGGAFLLGAANPKAYLAFASLFGSFRLSHDAAPLADGALKWSLCVLVMASADLAWLAIGMMLGKVPLTRSAERFFNIAMGALIVAACIATWLPSTPRT